MKEEYHKWYSQYLNLESEMLVFGSNGYPIILFPTSQGRYYECKDWGLINSVSDLINSGRIKIYCPDAVNSQSWLNYSIPPEERVKTHLAYEGLVIYDVIEFAKHETGIEKVCLAGCDLGAYYAVNTAFKHPDLVNYVISISGVLDIKQFIWGYYDDDCYFNNPPDYLSNLTDEWYLERFRKMGIFFTTGEFDSYLEQSKRVSSILESKGVNNRFDIQPQGRHDWELWRKIFPEYLKMIF